MAMLPGSCFRCVEESSEPAAHPASRERVVFRCQMRCRAPSLERGMRWLPPIAVEGEVGRDHKLYFSAGGCAAAEPQRPANSLRTFAHPRDAIVPFAAALNHVRIEPTAVVTNEDT